MPVATRCLTVGLLAMSLLWLGSCDRGERKAPDGADSAAIVQDAKGLSHVIEQRFDRLAAGPAAELPYFTNLVLDPVRAAMAPMGRPDRIRIWS